MKPDDLTLVGALVVGIVAVVGVAKVLWNKAEAQTVAMIALEKQRANDAEAREKEARDRAARYEGDRTKSMESVREGFKLLETLATQQAQDARECREGLAAIFKKLDDLNRTSIQASQTKAA